MNYWIFSRADGSVLAVADAGPDNVAPSLPGYELMFDRPAPRVIAEAYIEERGGDFREGDEVDRALEAVARQRNRFLGRGRVVNLDQYRLRPVAPGVYSVPDLAG